jgi:hypothetical protein
MLRTWPLVRHVRYCWLAYGFWRWWSRVGRHLWLTPNEADWRYLNDVWRGRA